MGPNTHFNLLFLILVLVAQHPLRVAAEIFDAIRKGDAQAVTALLRNESNLNVHDEQGRTPLMVATIGGQLEIAKLLLIKGANAQIKGTDGRTARDLARDLKIEGIESLLLSAKLSEEADAALTTAIISGDISQVRAALDTGANVNARGDGPPLRMAKDGNVTPLMLAAKGEVSVFKFLLERKAFPNAVTLKGQSVFDFVEYSQDSDEKLRLLKVYGGVTNAKSINRSLRTFIGQNDEATVTANLKRGADPNHFEGNESVLMIAARYGYGKIVRILLDNNANANVRTVAEDYKENLGRTALFNAAANGNLETVAILLSNGANPNIPTRSGFTPLMAAASKGTPAITKALLDAGVEVNAMRSDGNTALSSSIADNAGQEIIDLLLAGGANLTTGRGIEPLIVAAKVGNLALVKKICEVAHPNQSVKDTALLKATYFVQNDVVKFLIEKGANANIHDEQGRSAVSLAISAGNQSAVALLVSAGATNIPLGFDSKSGAPSPPPDLAKISKSGAPSPPPDLAKISRATWREMVAPYDVSSGQFSGNLLSEAAFKEKFGSPDKTQRIGDYAYWYYRCSDGLIQVVINVGFIRSGVMIKQINEY